ncbi:MAG: methyl-accepting chemotaxis protein [Planctomycetota bacterium]|jgi:methyl-accepting chemotaxis protein
MRIATKLTILTTALVGLTALILVGLICNEMDVLGVDPAVLDTVFVAAVLVVIPAALAGFYVARGIARPITRIADAAEEVALGDLSASLNVKAGGEVGRMATAFQHIIDTQRHKQELAQSIAEGNLDQFVEFASERDELGKAFLQMVRGLNDLLNHMRETTERVSSGAGKISNANQALSRDAAHQANSLQEVNRSLQTVTEQVRQNAESAREARGLTQTMRQAAEEGNARMAAMTESMTEVDEATQSIGSIIKSIDDIAFQTNLLALNAAVEAARAGRHGKGFAVVAEEVRALAGRSASAAKQTADLIQNTVTKVAHSGEIAEATAASLRTIYESMEGVNEQVAAIAAASDEQSASIVSISDSVHAVDEVVRRNVEGVDETAQAAVGLSEQAQVLNGAMSRFRLRDVGRGREARGSDSA